MENMFIELIRSLQYLLIISAAIINVLIIFSKEMILYIYYSCFLLKRLSYRNTYIIDPSAFIISMLKYWNIYIVTK